MATATQTKTAPKSAPKTTAKASTKKPAAPKAAAKKPAAKANKVERTVKTVVLDSAYAGVGLTDTAVSVIKTLPAKAAELQKEAPVKVKALTALTTEAPKALSSRLQAATTQGKATVTGVRVQLEQQLDIYAARGRNVVGKVQNSATTKKALEQSRIARAQVKAAATSVRKTVGATTDAVSEAVETISA